MNDSIEGAVAGGFIALAAFAALVFIGMVMIPVVVVGGGTLFYVYNIHIPNKRHKEAVRRMDELYARAQRLAPTKQAMRDRMKKAGVTDSTLHSVAATLFDMEGLDSPPSPPINPTQIDAGNYQEKVEKFLKAAQGNRFNGFVDHMIDVLGRYQPSDNFEDYMFRSERERTPKEIDELILLFLNDDGYCKELIEIINVHYRLEGEKMPSECGKSDYAWRYLKDTPLMQLRYATEWIGLKDRMYHTYLLGSSGSGKTNLIENIIAHDLHSADEPCVVVIDSQTQLTEKLARLDIDATAYFTPQYALALNLFDVGYENMKGHGIEGETLINKTVGLLSFVMEGMMGTQFTNPQKTIFQYAIQLVISIKGGNIFTFMEILSEGGLAKYRDQIAELDANTQRFFEMDFGSDEYKRTREAIRRRLAS